MALTTHFLSLLMIVCWRKHLIYPIIFYGIFAAIELTYLSSALRKVGDLPPATAWWTLISMPQQLLRIWQALHQQTPRPL